MVRRIGLMTSGGDAPGMNAAIRAAVRHALGQRGPRDKVPPAPVPASDLVALLHSRRPEALTAIGVVGLAIIVWLMVFKPT